MKYFIALMLVLTLGVTQSSNAQGCIQITKLAVAQPQCDFNLCEGNECDVCATFQLVLPAGCQLGSIGITPPPGDPCFTACSAEFPDRDPARESCGTGFMKLYPPNGVPIIGQPTTIFFTICSSTAGNFTITVPQCASGCAGSYVATVP
jgi:hypothetical protein